MLFILEIPLFLQSRLYVLQKVVLVFTFNNMIVYLKITNFDISRNSRKYIIINLKQLAPKSFVVNIEILENLYKQ